MNEHSMREYHKLSPGETLPDGWKPFLADGFSDIFYRQVPDKQLEKEAGVAEEMELQARTTANAYANMMTASEREPARAAAFREVERWMQCHDSIYWCDLRDALKAGKMPK